MYLARKRIKGTMNYFIRETVERAGETLGSRDLLGLGPDPSRFVVYPGGRSFYIDERVSEWLAEAGVDAGQDELEDIFWPFLRPDVKRSVEPFRSRAKSGRRKKMTPLEEERLRVETHIFDKRRMHYLKFGRMNQGFVGQMPGKLLRDVDGKSRDEIEQYFWRMEKQVLKRHEIKIYVYVIFDLKRHFAEMAAKRAPELLDECVMDECFLDELCRLNCSKKFWSGELSGNSLNEYLVRYLLMFFDNDFAQSNWVGDIFREFADRRRNFMGYPRSGMLSVQEASDIFEVSENTLNTIDRTELIRLYRRLARKHHPDRGGEHDKFISLTEAFQSVMRRRRFKA